MTLKEYMKEHGLGFLTEAAECASMAALKEFFVSRGVSATDDELAKFYALLSKRQAKELSDEELEGVSGGGFYYPVYGCPHGVEKLVIQVTYLGVAILSPSVCKNCKNHVEIWGPALIPSSDCKLIEQPFPEWE